MSCSVSMCQAVQLPQAGGYTPTAKNLDLLRRFKRGESIGFTARSSLRAKALLPRISRKYKGQYVLGPKYSGTGKEKVVGTRGLQRKRLTRRHRPHQSGKTRSLRRHL